MLFSFETRHSSYSCCSRPSGTARFVAVSKGPALSPRRWHHLPSIATRPPPTPPPPPLKNNYATVNILYFPSYTLFNIKYNLLGAETWKGYLIGLMEFIILKHYFRVTYVWKPNFESFLLYSHYSCFDYKGACCRETNLTSNLTLKTLN
jgi:hypothetical protein